MNCRKFNKSLSAYLYGEISAGMRYSLRDHAAVCPPCGKELEKMEETVLLLRSALPSEFSSSELASLRSRVKEDIARGEIKAARRRRPNFLEIVFPPRLAPVMAALVLAALVGVTFLLRPSAYVISEPKMPTVSEVPEVKEAVTMTEVMEEEYQSVSDLYQEIEVLRSLFPDQKDTDSEAGAASNKKIMKS